MLRIRTLVLAIAAATALSSGMANALGLGELTLRSAQGEPLDAEIELLDVRDLSAAELAPSLAPPEEYLRAGLPMPTYLEDLSFTPVIVPDGRSVLRVTSSAPLPETQVKFLVQVMWPQGRLLRDYSLSLDRAQAGARQSQAGIEPAVSGAATYTSQRRDTLWQIAARNSQGGSVQQTMLAIQALNPDAFIGNNINRLKVGQVLRLPDAQQIRSIPQGEAVREVAEQYAAWREGRRLGPRARQLDATRRVAADAAPAQVARPDNLRLVSPSSQPAAGDAKALADQLAVAQESLDTSRRDNEELRSRLADLQSQLDKLQRLIELKNDQLARLQAQGAAEQPATAVPADPATGPVAGTQPASSALGDDPVAETPPGSGPAIQAPLAGEPVLDPSPAATDTRPEAAQDTSAAPVGAQKSALDQLFGNPLLLALIAGSLLLVLLILLLILLRKRKAEQEAEKHRQMARALAEQDEDPDFDMPPGSFDELDTTTLSPAAVAASAAAAVAAERLQAQPVAEAPAAGREGPERVLAEAELKLAAGRLNDAAELLESGVATYPERSDLRLKLMEVYARQGDQYGFVSQERQLPGTEQNRAQVDGLRQRYPAMLAAAAAGLGAAALAAEMDQHYVQELLEDPAVRTASSEPASAFDQAADDIETIPDDALGAVADLRLDAELPVVEQAEPPLLDPLAAPSAAEQNDADADFEAMLAQAQAQAGGDEFDLDVGAAQEQGEPAATQAAQTPASPKPATPPADASDQPDLSEDFDLSLALEDDSPAGRDFASELDDVNAELDKLSQDLESPSLEPQMADASTPQAAEPEPEPEPVDDLDFDFFSDADEVTTKLDLARAYIDMGDQQGARDILDEVVKDGDAGQRQEAEDMLSRLA
ncbi:FimV/HubP family polar landmark protein [Pseudomonas sp. Marseille-QA0332]